MDNKENYLEEEDILEEKNLTKSHRKRWVLVSIIVSTVLIWILYFTGNFRLLSAILITIFSPLAIFVVYYLRKSKYKILLNKIALVGCAGYVITVVIWLFAGRALLYAPWAPFYDKLSEISRSVIILILMGAIYGIVAYILYRFGKNREWKIGWYY